VMRANGRLQSGTWQAAYRQLEGRRLIRPLAFIHDDADLNASGGHEAFIRSGLSDWSNITWQPLEWNLSPIERGSFAADVWIIRGAKKWLLFDTKTRQVLRWSNRIYSATYCDLRKTFEQHVPSASFRVGISDPTELYESFEHGQTVRDLSDRDQIRIVRRVLRGLASLIESTRTQDPRRKATAHTPIGDLLAKSAIPEARARRQEIMQLVGEQEILVPSHGDLHDLNIVVTDNGPLVIDFDELADRGFWFDAILLLKKRLRLPQWINGEFDDELAAIWAAAEVHPVKWNPSSVHLMRLASAAVRAEQHVARNLGSVSFLRRRLRETRATSLWVSETQDSETATQ
jgi:hypothetical protein